MQAGGLIASGFGLEACSRGPSGEPQSSGSPGKPGGTLRAAFVGVGSAETLDPFMGPTPLDSVRIRAIHGLLGVLDPTQPDGVRLGALESVKPSQDLSTYTLRLRSGITFTDGSKATAQDLVYSLNAPMKLPALPYMKIVGANFDLEKARVVDDLTVELPTLRPIADGAMVLCQNTVLIKDGTAAFEAGTPTCGPFKVAEFVPGQGTALKRFDEYFGGAPLLEGLELRSIPALDARVSALTSGQVDYIGDVGPVKYRTLAAEGKVTLSKAEPPFVTALSFNMNLKDPAFADVRVRQAFKLAVDRQNMLDTVFSGGGVLGNDLSSLGFPDYADGIPQRQRDVARAKELLEQAGAKDLKVTLVTGSEIQGMAEASTMMVENLKDIGVTVTLDAKPQGQLYADIATYMSSAFAANYAPPTPTLSGYTTTRVAGSPSTFGFDRPDIDEDIFQARGSADAGQRKEKAAAAQQKMWDEDNVIIPVFVATIDAHATGVKGVVSEPWPTFDKASLS